MPAPEPVRQSAAVRLLVNYATGPLSLALNQTMTAFSLNTTGEIWKGIGAGRVLPGRRLRVAPGAAPTTISPPAPERTNPEQFVSDHCAGGLPGRRHGLSYQFGNDYGGSSTINEVYMELNFPLLKNAFLRQDAAARP